MKGFFMGSSSGGPSTLTIDLRTLLFNEDELLVLRKITNELASDPFSVEHCRVDLESAEVRRRSLIFRTDDPERLWKRICLHLFSNSQLGERLVSQSAAYWRGETICDRILIHSWDAATPTRNPFKSRVECPKCGGFYVLGNLYPRCPHCK